MYVDDMMEGKVSWPWNMARGIVEIKQKGTGMDKECLAPTTSLLNADS